MRRPATPRAIPDGYVTLPQLADRSGLAHVTLCRLVNEGLVRAEALGPVTRGGRRQWLVQEQLAAAFVEAVALADEWGTTTIDVLRMIKGPGPVELQRLRPALFPETVSGGDVLAEATA